MRKWLFIWMVLVGLVSCSREQDAEREDDASLEGKMVTVTFSVTADCMEAPTKALDETAELHNLYLAVFGRSGYLKQYVQAQNLTCKDENGDKMYQEYDDWQGETKTGVKYTFTAQLALSENPRIIHFIGNAPSSISYDNCEVVLPALMSENPGDCSFWQMKELPHIRAKKYKGSVKTDGKGNKLSPGDYIDIDGNKITSGTGYIPEDDTKDLLNEIPLIRNWSKIVVEKDTDPGDPDYPEEQDRENDCYFDPISYAVVNAPTRGTLVPHCANTGFVQDYQKKSHDVLLSEGYTGNMPDLSVFDSDLSNIPGEELFENPKLPAAKGKVADASDPNAGVYLYERAIPTDKIPATYVIVYGHYRAADNPDDGDSANDAYCYYKIDLMSKADDDASPQYYPIFRNFKYQILIQKIRSKGHPTPRAAATAVGSGDVSADINARHLSDISDGVGRLMITPWMAHTFVEARTEEDEEKGPILFAAFMKDVHKEEYDGTVKVRALDMAKGVDPVIKTLSIDSTPNTEGWRAIHFTTYPKSDRTRSQTIRVTGSHASGSLYRDIVITLMPYQTMSLSCPSRVLALKGEEVTLSIKIPDGLSESMFPLDFTIEPEDMTLTPDNSGAESLPVGWGTSISKNDGYKGKQSFHYTRTLTWAEYSDYTTMPREVDENGKYWRTFYAHFCTNRDFSETTLWVYNDYFGEPTSIAFTNYELAEFRNLYFTSPVIVPDVGEDPEHATATFYVTELPEGGFPQIHLTPIGVTDIIVDGASESNQPVWNETEGYFTYTPTSRTVNLSMLVNGTTSDVQVTLEAEGYESNVIRPYRFSDAGLRVGARYGTDSNLRKTFSGVISGYTDEESGIWDNFVTSTKDEKVVFAYLDDPAKPNVPVTLVLNGLVTDSGNKTTYSFSPTGPTGTNSVENYHEILLKASAGTTPVSFTLTAEGYLQEKHIYPRYNGTVKGVLVGRNQNEKVFRPTNDYGFSTTTPKFTIKNSNKQPIWNVSFNKIYALNSNGVILNGGEEEPFVITVESVEENYNISLIRIETAPVATSWVWKDDSGHINATVKAKTSAEGAEFKEIPNSFCIAQGDKEYFYATIPNPTSGNPGPVQVQITLTVPQGQQICFCGMALRSFNGTF